jgi:hypothetical protein
MCCITLTALEATMATTELTRAGNLEVRTPWLPQNSERKPVRMNWVVVTDNNGQQQLRMHWELPASD